jgi:hypothetical protein
MFTPMMSSLIAMALLPLQSPVHGLGAGVVVGVDAGGVTVVGGVSVGVDTGVVDIAAVAVSWTTSVAVGVVVRVIVVGADDVAVEGG